MADALVRITAVDNASAAFMSVKGALNSTKEGAMALQAGLVGLAGSMGALALGSMVKGVADAAKGLHDLSIQTGASVEALSGMASVGKTTGTTAQDIASSMSRLARNLAGATEEGKGTGKAIQALGLNMGAFKSLKPDEQMLALAKSMEKFADGNGKAAVAAALFGKEGAKQLPFMKDLAQVGELQAKVTTAQADAADNFSDNLIKVKASGDAWKKELSLGMIPALNEGLQAFLDITNGTGGLRDEVRRLSKDGSIAEWTRSAIIGASYVVDAFIGVKRVIQSVGEFLGAAWASTIQFLTSVGEAHLKIRQLNITGAIDTMGAGIAKQKTIWGEFGGQLDSVLGDSTLGQKLRKRAVELKGFGEAGRDARKQLEFDNTADDKGAGGLTQLEKQHNAYLDLVASINEKISANDLETDSGRKLMESEKLRLEIIKLVGKETLNAKDAQSAETEALLQRLKVAETAKMVRESEYKQALEIATGRQKLVKDGYDEAVKLDELLAANAASRSKWSAKQLEEIRIETEGLTQNTAERDIANAMRQAEVEGIKRGTGEWEAYRVAVSAALSARDGLRKNIDDFRAVWESVDQTAHTVFTNIFQGGQSVFTKLRDTLKSTLLDLLYQMTVKKWVFDITASVSGVNSGVASTVLGQGNSLMNGAMSAIGNKLGITDTIGSLFGGGSGIAGIGASGAEIAGTVASTSEALAGMGASAAEATAAAEALGSSMAATGGALSGISGALAAIPGWGWAAAGALALAGLAQGGEKRSGGQFEGTSLIAAPTGGVIGDAPSLIAGMEKSTTDLLKTFGSALGLTTVRSGLESSKSGNGFAYAGGILSNGLNFGNGNDGLGYMNRRGSMSEEQAQAAYVEELKRAQIAALQTADLPGQIGDYLKQLGDANKLSDGALDQSVAYITNIAQQKQAIDAQRTQLQSQLLDLQSTDAENLARARKTELAAMDDSLRGLAAQVYAAQDLKKAADSAAAAQRSLADMTRGRLTDNVSAARNALADAYAKEGDLLRTTIDRHQAYAKQLVDFRDSLMLGADSPLSVLARSGEAQRQYDAVLARAQGGDLDAIGALQAASSNLLAATRDSAGSKLQMDIASAKVAGTLTVMAARSSSAATLAQQQLTALDASVNGLLTVNNSVLSVRDAIAQLSGALGSAMQGGAGAAAVRQVVGSTAPTEQWLGTALGDVWVSSGGAVGTRAAGGGVNIATADGLNISGTEAVNAAIGAINSGNLAMLQAAQARTGISNESLNALLAGTGYHVDGSHADGLDRVPFDGYRSVLHAGERVKTAAQSRSEDALVAEVKALRETATRQQAALDAIATHTFATWKNTAELKDRGVYALNSPSGEVLVTTT